MIRAARASLVALLVSAGVALALDFGSVAGQVFTGGTVSGQAYSLPAAGSAWTPATALDAVAAYDPGDTTTLIKGGYTVSSATNYFARTSGAIPLVSGGVPQYPISFVVWFKLTSTAGFNTLLEIGGSGSDRTPLYFNGTTLIMSSVDGGSSADASATTAATAGRWGCAIGVLGAADARAIYTDQNTTGGTNATSHTLTALDRLYVGRDVAGGAGMGGVIAYTAILPVDLSGAGNASIRTAIFNGADPETASSTTATALYKLDNDNGADAKGSFDLTASGTPVAQNNLIVMRDLVGTYHQRATTSAPTYDATLFSNRGGVTFTAASSQFLVCESSPISGAPLQAYAVARSASTTTLQGVVWVGDKDATTRHWVLAFAGATANDPILWRAQTASVNADAFTSSGYTADTTRLLWGLETSTTSRAARLDGANEGTETTSADPSTSGIDRLALGGFLDSSPSNYLNGAIGFALLLNSTDVSERADVHDWVDTNFGTSLP